MSKRKLSDDDETSNSSSSSEEPDSPVGSQASEHKRRKRVRFSELTVFHFPRIQGFSCVPSAGGSSLGMDCKHVFVEKIKFAERFSNEEDDFDDTDYDDYGHIIMPVSYKARKTLLKSAGVKKIDKKEARECMDIRTSRQTCGCDCLEVCRPESCTCILDGISCQVDRESFPCSCTRDGCQNINGRHEYDPVSVRRHFIEAINRTGKEQSPFSWKNFSSDSDEGVETISAANHIFGLSMG